MSLLVAKSTEHHQQNIISTDTASRIPMLINACVRRIFCQFQLLHLLLHITSLKTMEVWNHSKRFFFFFFLTRGYKKRWKTTECGEERVITSTETAGLWPRNFNQWARKDLNRYRTQSCNFVGYSPLHRSITLHVHVLDGLDSVGQR